MIISKIRDLLEIAIPFILENINLKSAWKYGSLGVMVISKSYRRKGVRYTPLPITPSAAVGAQALRP
jgi:hypothetical protein